MFAHILLGATLATATPSPTPPPALKTIATLHVSGRCQEIVTRANSAISSALVDNETLRQTITQLRVVNLDDGNLLHRNAGLNALRDLASNLYTRSRDGDAEIKHLRALAAQTSDPQQAKALKAFADALGGALGRQLKVARDLDGYLAYVDARDMQRFSESGSAFSDDFFAEDPYAPQSARSRNTATAYAQNAAHDFESRLPLIVGDESRAAGHIDEALGACQTP